MRRGDILIRLGKHEIAGGEGPDVHAGCGQAGETVKAVVLRDGQEVAMEDVPGGAALAVDR